MTRFCRRFALTRFRHRFTLALVSCVGAMFPASIPMIAAAGIATVLAPGEVAFATVWFVDLGGGSNSNNGTFASTPRLTPPTSINNGDTIYLWGQSTAGCPNVTYTNKSNVTLFGLPTTGCPRPIMHGGIQCGHLVWTQGADAGGGTKWSCPIGAGLTITRAAWKYDASVTSSGHHYGILRHTAGANVLGEYNYTGDTLTINIPTGQVPTAAADVIYATVDTVEAMVKFIGGSGNAVVGIDFKFLPAASGQYGWAVQFNGSGNSTIFDCRSWDTGYHSFGAALGNGDVSGCLIDHVVSYSCVYNGGHIVFHQPHVYGNLTNCRIQNSTIHMRRFLGVNGSSTTESTAVVQGQSANLQAGVITHSDSGTPIRDILIDNVTFIEYENSTNPNDPGMVFITASEMPALAGTWAWADGNVRIDRCRFIGGSAQVGTSKWRINDVPGLTVRRSIFDARNAGPSGNCSGGNGWFELNSATPRSLLFDACAFILNIRDDSSDSAGFLFFGAGHDVRFLNCSVFEVSTGHANNRVRAIFSPLFRTDVYIRRRGCVFAFAESYAGNKLTGTDITGLDAGHHDSLDNAYFNIGAYSENAALDTETEWLAAGDTSGRVLPSQPFVRYAVDGTLGLGSGSPLWGYRRATSLVIPSTGGIDGGAYAKFFGAYQSSSAAVTVSGAGFSDSFGPLAGIR